MLLSMKKKTSEIRIIQNQYKKKILKMMIQQITMKKTTDKVEMKTKNKTSKYTEREKQNKIYSHFLIVRVYIKKDLQQ